jgi:gas vesicle protein
MWERNYSLKNYYMNNTTKILVALGAGLVVGGVLGIVFAPDKGSETRRKFTEKGKMLAGSIRNKFEESMENIFRGNESIHERKNDKVEVNA